MQHPLHSNWSKRGQWGGWEETGQMSSGSGLIFCFSCHSPYSFTMRKCRPSSLLRMTALPSHWRMSMARFGMRIMRWCVSRAWPGLSRGKRAGQGQGLAWYQVSDFLVLTKPFLYSLQISIFVNPSDAPQSVQKELKSEKEKLVKVMQTQDQLCVHIQTHLFFPHYYAPSPLQIQSHWTPWGNDKG